MKKSVIKQLNQLNQNFYHQVGTEFDESRQFFWSGWSKVVNQLDFPQDKKISVLDVGCGNGRFAQFLDQKTKFNGDYLGLDNNQQLLQIAQAKKLANFSTKFKHFDLVKSLLENNFEVRNVKFDLIVSFGVIHHLPSFELRKKLISQLFSKLNPGGWLVISIWRFAEFERFKNKVIDPKKVNIDSNELETDDFILDWKRGKTAYRYCHYLDNEETKKLLSNLPSDFVTSFRSDGKEGSVNQYLLLKK